MPAPSLRIRKTWSVVEETRLVVGADDSLGPLRKVAVCAVISNPYAGQGFVQDLTVLVEGSGPLASELGGLAADLLGAPVASYGKAGMAGTAGEQEHANAALTSVFGDAFRASIGGGAAWISSTSKVCAPGTQLDVPLAYKDDVWVRSHYDSIVVQVADAPLEDEIVVVAAVASRGRINARLGGRSLAEAVEAQRP
jgi:hypothetical protein